MRLFSSFPGCALHPRSPSSASRSCPLAPSPPCGGVSSGSTSTGPVNLTFWSWVTEGVDKSVALWNQTWHSCHVEMWVPG